MIACGHRLLESPQLTLDRNEVGGAGEDVLAQRQPALQRRALVVERDARALGERELAAVDLGLAGEHAQEGRLAGAVGTAERDTLATLHLERDAVEEDAPGELLAQVRCDHDGHALRVVTSRAPEFEPGEESCAPGIVALLFVALVVGVPASAAVAP